MKEKEVQTINDNITKQIEIRGNIINSTIQIEALLNAVLTVYFCEKSADKRGQFFNYVLNDERFLPILKVETLNHLDILKKEYKEANNDLRRIFEIRNIVAHQLTVITKSDLMKKSLINFKKIKQTDLDELNSEFCSIKPRLMKAMVKVLGELTQS